MIAPSAVLRIEIDSGLLRHREARSGPACWKRNRDRDHRPDLPSSSSSDAERKLIAAGRPHHLIGRAVGCGGLAILLEPQRFQPRAMGGEDRVIELGVDLDGLFRRRARQPASAAAIGGTTTGAGAAAGGPLAVVIAPEAVAFGACSLGFCGGGWSIFFSTNSWYTKTRPSERRIASRSLLVSKRCLASDYSPFSRLARAGTGSYPWPPSG